MAITNGTDMSVILTPCDMVPFLWTREVLIKLAGICMVIFFIVCAFF